MSIAYWVVVSCLAVLLVGIKVFKVHADTHPKMSIVMMIVLAVMAVSAIVVGVNL